VGSSSLTLPQDSQQQNGTDHVSAESVGNDVVSNPEALLPPNCVTFECNGIKWTHKIVFEWLDNTEMIQKWNLFFKPFDYQMFIM